MIKNNKDKVDTKDPKLPCFEVSDAPTRFDLVEQ
jgi:hypothetical protein